MINKRNRANSSNLTHSNLADGLSGTQAPPVKRFASYKENFEKPHEGHDEHIERFADINEEHDDKVYEK